MHRHTCFVQTSYAQPRPIFYRPSRTAAHTTLPSISYEYLLINIHQLNRIVTTDGLPVHLRSGGCSPSLAAATDTDDGVVDDDATSFFITLRFFLAWRGAVFNGAWRGSMTSRIRGCLVLPIAYWPGWLHGRTGPCMRSI